jgi:hypothetical protein
MTRQLNEAVTHLFDETVHLTGIVEYGISWTDLLSGKVQPPPEGARFDLSFQGELRGDALTGKIKGVDFLEIRADGRFMLNIQATIVTDDGEAIALREDGVLTPGNAGEPAGLHLNMQFSTHSEKYGWLNKIQVWGIGKVHMQEGRVEVSAFAASTVPAHLGKPLPV